MDEGAGYIECEECGEVVRAELEGIEICQDDSTGKWICSDCE